MELPQTLPLAAELPHKEYELSSRAKQELFQAVRCGALAVAFPYGWATSIVEKFQLTPIPKAPAWLSGATNIDGRIIPVIDLSRYGAKGQRAERNDASFGGVTNKRLLIGGLQGSEDDDRLAILFSGMPQQIGRSGDESIHRASADIVANALTDGAVVSPKGERFAVVNVARLYAQLSAELSTL
jgi:chemotaxis signal transduction protein